MKKTIAVIGSAAALSFAGAGLAAAQDVDTVDPEGTQAAQVETANETGDDANNEDGANGDDVDTPRRSPTSPCSSVAPSRPTTSSVRPRASCPA
ncbi:hypothetical protein ACFSSF_16370 [Dietzia aerolata]|uniref:hypothetical protein n=1 Tax=Dietzia aerolata TaxID=595984 RepID=UPI003642CACC